MNKKKLVIVLVVLVVGIAGLWWWSVATRPFYPEINSPRPVLGSKGAQVSLEEFSDFQCPACKTAEGLVQDIVKTFGDRIQLTYRHYPLISVHQYAFVAAQASECANDQGKFWEFHDVMFDKQPALKKEDLKNYATQLGLKVDDFTACLDSRAKVKTVRDDMSEGDKRGVNATPTFFLNGDKVADWTKLKELIQAKLAGG